MEEVGHASTAQLARRRSQSSWARRGVLLVCSWPDKLPRRVTPLLACVSFPQPYDLGWQLRVSRQTAVFLVVPCLFRQLQPALFLSRTTHNDLVGIIKVGRRLARTLDVKTEVRDVRLPRGPGASIAFGGQRSRSRGFFFVLEAGEMLEEAAGEGG